MANQLSKNKCRKSIAEHKAVIALLEEIAKNDHVSTMSLMRQAIRQLIRDRINGSPSPEHFNSTVRQFIPHTPENFRSVRELSNFKKEQREFDQILLELHLSEPDDIETRNSVVSPNCRIEVLEFS